MMRLSSFVLLLLTVLLGGCTALEERQQADVPLIKEPANPAEAVGIAHDMAQRGRWSDAIGLLEVTAKRFPEDETVPDVLAGLRAGWAHERRILEDRILIADAESQQEKIGLLEQYSRAEPDNLILTSRRIYWREVLEGKLEALTACGEQHVAHAPELARRCFQVASRLPAGEDIEQRLARIDAQLRANETVAAERRKAREEKERQTRAKVLLGNAKRAIESHEYRRALDILDRVAKLQPNNREVAGLKEEALSMISPQVEALVKLGDHLYLDEQLEAAMATWRAALSLKPDDEDILARIERARNVLDRLEALRRQQRPSAIGE